MAKAGTRKHYLELELEGMIRRGDIPWAWLQGSLDGVWYWDLERPSEEWMSPEFWEVLGYDPAQMPHKATAWQGLIDPDDLETALTNFARHRDDPEFPYMQVVRYRAGPQRTVPSGWVYVRCRGMIVRNASGKAIRMLGCHNDVTDLKLVENALKAELVHLTSRIEALEKSP